MTAPYVAFYPSDWLAGTRGLTAEETGIYITLVAMMYEREAPIDMPDDRLARLCGCSVKAFRKACDSLIGEGKLHLKDGGIWNERAEKEIEKRFERTKSAKASVAVRWQKSKQNQRADDTNVKRSNYVRNTNQNQNQKVSLSKAKDTNAHDARGVLCAVLSEGVADAFLDHRKAKRAALTARAAELIVRKLAGHPNPDAVVEKSIMNGWTGVFPESVDAAAGWKPDLSKYGVQ